LNFTIQIKNNMHLKLRKYCILWFIGAIHGIYFIVNLFYMPNVVHMQISQKVRLIKIFLYFYVSTFLIFFNKWITSYFEILIIFLVNKKEYKQGKIF
jgi:polyferredoxin